MGEVIWRQRATRHYRRYARPDRFPYLVMWGNTRLNTPAKMRTFLGARLVAAWWMTIGRRGVFIQKREG